MSSFAAGAPGALVFAALTLALLNRPPVPASATSSTVPIATPVQNEVWTLQIDTSTLNQDLNAWAQAQGAFQTPLGTAQLRQLSTDIRDNELNVSGTADTGWFSVLVDAAATASIQNGSVQVHIERAHINHLDMPDAIRVQLEQEVQTQLVASLSTYHLNVRSVQLSDRKLIIAGTRF